MMSDEQLENSPSRPFWHRVGIALLNLPAPGAGVLRAGRPLLAVGFLALATCLLLVPSLLPGRGNEAIAGLAIIALAVLSLANTVAAIVVSWRHSRTQPDTMPWFSRAPAIIAFIGIGIGMTFLLPDTQSSFKSYYTPSESMLPTFRVGDRYWADMRQPIDLRRGDVVVFRTKAGVFSSRIIGVGGDVVAVEGGVPVVNGVRAVVTPNGNDTVIYPDKPIRARRFVETRDGRSHGVVDIGETPQDNLAAVKVPSGTIFVMGDNRDNAADSRFAPEMGGVGFVAVEDVLGRPVFRYFSRAGSPLGSLADK